MQIRQTTRKELDEVMQIYAYAREFMAAHGNPRQWGPNKWPPRELIEEDIRQGRSYVCEEAGVLGAVFFYRFGDRIEETYNHIDGAWKLDAPYGVVHRIASSGRLKGAGSFCLNWAFKQCGHLRIDTHEDNRVMQNLLEKLGFEKCGIIYVHEDNDPRFAYEKFRKEGIGP